MQALAALAAVVAGYLALISLFDGQVLGCGGGGLLDCDPVLQSRWASFLGIPVSLGAVLVYAAMFMTLFRVRRIELPLTALRAWRLLITMAVLAAGAAVWFIGLLVFVLDGFCLFCTLIHVCGLILAWMIFSKAPISRRGAPEGRQRMTRRTVWAFAGIGIGVLLLMIVGQLAWEPQSYMLEEYPSSSASELAEPTESTTQASFPARQTVGSNDIPERSASAERQREVTFIEGRVKIDVYKVPIIGSADAPYVMVELLDYTCHHCLKMHRQLKQVRQRYGDQLCIVPLLVPMDKKCNPMVKVSRSQHRDACELAKIALALWQVAPEAFAEFHSWMLDSTKPRSPLAAKKWAADVAGAQRIDEALRVGELEKLLAENIRIYRNAGGGMIPKLLFGKYVASGVTPSAAALFRILEQKWHIRPSDP